MKIRHLLLTATLAAISQQMSATDIHGVNGYYNYTAAQMKSDGVTFPMFTDGRQYAEWYNPDAEYDGDYVKFVMGLNSRTATTLNVGKFHSSTIKQPKWSVSFKWLPAEPLRITKNYPVVAWKFSLPINSADSAYTEVFCEHWMIDPYTGEETTITNKWGDTEKTGYYDPIKGLASNGRCSYWAKYPKMMVQKQSTVLGSLSMDSCCAQANWKAEDLKLHSNGFVYDGYLNQTRNGYTGTSIEFIRLPKTANDKAEFIALVNYYCIPDTADDKAASGRLLDRIDYLQIPRQHFNFTCQADTLNANGESKSNDEKPYVLLKWMKTFASIEDAEAAITEANNWGDGSESADYTALTYQLYYAEQKLKEYIHRNNPTDEAWLALQTAYNEAETVYKTTGATDEQYSAATTALTTAMETFNAAVDFDKTLVYNYISSATNSAIIPGTQTTIDGVTGRVLTIGGSDAQSAFSFAATGSTVSGQRSYYIKTTTGAVQQMSDGTLLLVEGGTPSAFTFGDHDGEGGYTMKCGDYYYYVSDGALMQTKAMDETVYDDYDAMTAYLFNMKDALADYAGSEEGLFEGWEFNDAAATDPSAVQEGETDSKMVNNWRKSRWRMQSHVEQATVKNSDKTDATCILLTSTATYSTFDGASTGIVNDYSSPAAMRYDAGTQDPAYVRDPSPRDSSIAYTIDAGVTRYFAIKMKGTEDVSFDKFTFLNPGEQVIITADQKAGQKGDVLYWDLLQSGFSVGPVLFTSAFFSPAGFTSADSKLYVDWMRTYKTVDEIPTESFADDVASGIATINTDGSNMAEGVLYTIDGRTAGIYGKTAVKAGLYIVKVDGTVKKIIIK